MCCKYICVVSKLATNSYFLYDLVIIKKCIRPPFFRNRVQTRKPSVANGLLLSRSYPLPWRIDCEYSLASRHTQRFLVLHELCLYCGCFASVTSEFSWPTNFVGALNHEIFFHISPHEIYFPQKCLRIYTSYVILTIHNF